MEFVIEYYLPITADEWDNLAGPLYRRLSDSDTTNYAFRRHWYRTLKGKTDEWIVTLREIIALKKKGLPYTNPFTKIRYNDNEQGGGVMMTTRRMTMSTSYGRPSSRNRRPSRNYRRPSKNYGRRGGSSRRIPQLPPMTMTTTTVRGR